MARSVFDELAERIRGIARDQARQVSPPVQRWKVVTGDPLVVEQIGGDLTLEEGDPDVEIERAVLKDRPAKGDTVRVHRDEDGDWIISGVVE